MTHMTAPSRTHAARHRPRGTIALLTALLARIERRRQQSLAIQRLRRFDDHLLRDIGLTRESIKDAVRHDD